MRLFLTFCAALLSSAAFAQAPIRIAPPAATAPGLSAAPIPALPTAQPGATVAAPPAITPELCQRLAARQGGVPPATYQPGVDVYGRKVAPADLPADLPNNSGLTAPITTEIPLGRNAAAGGRIKGYVTLQPDGSILLDGQKLPSGQEYGLLDTCRQQGFIR